MENEKVEQETTQKPDGSDQADVVQDDQSEDNDELVEKNKKLYARAKKAEEEAKLFKEKFVASEAKLNKQASKPKDTSSESQGNVREEVREYAKLYSQGYSDDEVDQAVTFAKATGKRPTEVVNDDFFKAGIEAMRAKAKVAQATPSPSTSSLSKKKEVPFSKMTKDQQQSIWQARLEESKRKATSGSQM